MKRTYRKMIMLTVTAVLLGAVVRLFYGEEQITYAQNVSAADLLSFEPQAGAGAVPSYAMLHKGGASDRDNANRQQAFESRANAYSGASPDASLEIRTEPSGEKALYWLSEAGWVEWKVDVPETGAYRLEIDYLPVKGSYSNIVRGLMIDGSIPFKEAEQFTLERYWKDAKFPYDKNAIGQEVRPVQTEIEGARSAFVASYDVSSTPLEFQLTKGVHTIRLIGGKEPVALTKLRWSSPETIPAYEEYKQAHPDTAAQTWYEVVEAERYSQKSNIAVQTNYFSEPHISPDPKGRIVYNVLGGDRWRTPGDWVEWTIEVPDDGWYDIDLKFYQGFRRGLQAYRTVMLDGKVPFREMLHYAIPANDNFQIRSLQDEHGNPFQFYLTKGKHTLRLVADASLTKPAVIALQHALQELDALDRSIRLITGNYGQGAGATKQNLDTLRTWNLQKSDPGIDDKLRSIIARFQQAAAFVDGLNQNKSDLTTAIDVAVDNLQAMAAYVNDIPNRMTDFATIQSHIVSWLPTLSNQSVMLDYIVVRSPDAQTGLKEPTSLSRIPYMLGNFARTFYMTYDTRKQNKREAITVWVQRGRDYAELLREMVDRDFTPNTGIEVNINLMPNPNQLILSNASGEQPDVALGVSMETPVDYAMRGAVADLKKFPGFQEVYDRFNPGAMRSFAYDGGTYALPEVQNFQVLFYRTDIFDRLKLKVPDTWDDVYELLPSLQEKGMTMYVPTKNFLPYLFQNGADLYSADGLRNNLGSEQALAGFEQWTNLYTKYYLPLEAPAFLNHFRDGDMPVGIADFNMYVQLMVAAPEITGHWKIARVPGMKQKNGEVVRWTDQSVSAAVIMEKSGKQEQAWEFMQWWTSKQTQVQYGNDIESLYGLEYRWNTANLQAMKSLSWPAEDLKTIVEQGRWVKNVPYVPGYYFLAREMDFAWNSAVLTGKPPKEALESAEVSLQREMLRRQEDFGIAKDANLRVPIIDRPFDGEVRRQ
ncbi:extracellular solute-binding protein [Paenibacillus sp. MBLB4367]|uniref:extracellular solute-binding protein n=1 Tax=Paenibacillus sp. MBLB4367 TaxID=3384767 RepID=UPI003908145A